MDRLSQLLNRFSLSAGVFYTGNICGVHDFDRDERRGHVHLIKRGPVRLVGVPGGGISIVEPSLLFFPRPDVHQLIADDRDGADVVCASIQFGAGGHNPITDALPSLVLVPLAQLSGAQPLLELMFEEAFADHGGRQAALDRLCELLLIRLLRFCLDRGIAKGGALSGLADARLAKALTALHADPAREWDLAEMAEMAGMSRARFAVHFREVTGETPADYLASWRINLAQGLLRSGRPLKHVSHEVGYGSASALTRAFVRKVGASPMSWLRQAQARGRPDDDAAPTRRVRARRPVKQVRRSVAGDRPALPSMAETNKGCAVSSFASYQSTLIVMALAALLLVVQLIVADLTAIQQRHKAGYPIPADSSQFLFRAARAHANTNESIAAFALLAITGILLAASPRWLNALALLWLAARSVHMLAYYLNRKPLRSAAFAVSLLALLGMLATVVLG